MNFDNLVKTHIGMDGPGSDDGDRITGWGCLAMILGIVMILGGFIWALSR